MSERLLVHARYEAGPLLGRGAQGYVLRVFDREARARPLVAKVWNAGRFDAAGLGAEFGLLRRLAVPGLVHAHDLGRDEVTGAPFLVEDFVDGVTALEHVQRSEIARSERLLHVLAEAAATLSALHEAAFVHGDVKPEHVRVSERGVFLLDLGCALAAEHGSSAGLGLTPAFAAPEVLAGARPGRAADLFSLGAVCFHLATGGASRTAGARLRRLSPWLPPSVGDVIEALLQPHPSDRPERADDVLALLGRGGVANLRRAAPAPIGRARELEQLGRTVAGVRYVVGPSGSGKSHLAREVATRALLAGRAVRRVAFPHDDAGRVSKLVAFLRGASLAWPFREQGSESAPLLLVLDDLHAAPSELVAALDAYRCRADREPTLDVLATARAAPAGAERITLERLDSVAFVELCRVLGISNPARIAELGELSGHYPGWVVAADGRVPLTRDMVLERARSLTKEAAASLALLALLGGTAAQALFMRLAPDASVVSELLAAGLVVRRAQGEGVAYALMVPELAGDIATPLGSFELSERLASCLLEHEAVSARLLLNVAGSAFPPPQRQALLERAVELARRSGRAADEVEGLLALAASPTLRSRELLLRLERLTRHAGSPHPQVLLWLNEAATREPALLPLAHRREAERAARSGETARALELLSEADAAARAQDDAEQLALCLATRGALALYRADTEEADRALRDAAARLALLDDVDPEERARLDHNLGVVSLYRDRLDDAISAFEGSLELKRRLGDRAGVRSCLLNLGLALSRRGAHLRAERALEEAVALARSLGQEAGRAWCLAARADLEVRRADAAAAERFVAEASAIEQAPPVVTADLCILRGQVALLAGDGARAARAVQALDGALRQGDALLDAKATLLEAGAALASLPAEPRRAARLCVRVLRAARSKQLLELEPQARALLHSARARRTRAVQTRYPASMDGDAELWTLLERVAAAPAAEPAPLELLRLARRLSGAERALLALCTAEGAPSTVWGVDFDGFALPEAAARCDPAALEARTLTYLRDVDTSAGRGSRLAIPRALDGGAVVVLMLEQRFQVGAFDAVSEELANRLGTLAALAVRLSEAPAQASAPGAASQRLPQPAAAGQTTALPVLRSRRRFAGIVGSSRALELALAKLDGAVDSDLPVLIAGETGTGKELFARALHEHGRRAAAPLVIVNCAAVPDSLFEAELFGHARGAFTGADRARPGLLARAEGGTLFLDEIGELPPARQASLLRVLESRRYRAVGSDEEKPFDVRIVTATNRDLEREVESGAFRRDLLFRINVIEVRVPALRERKEDIPLLVRAFLERSGSSLTIAPDAMLALEQHDWLGNVRELEHQIQRLALLGLPRVERAYLPRAMRQGASATASEAPPPDGSDERAEVERALAVSRGNITHAARALGLTRHGLKKRMLRLGLRARAQGEES